MHAQGLGRTPGLAELFLAEGDYAGGSHSLGKGDSANSVSIEIESIDHLAASGFPTPTVLKVDVERAEMEVLLGAEQLLAEQRVRELFLEVHPGRIITEGVDAEALEWWLQARGYSRVWTVLGVRRFVSVTGSVAAQARVLDQRRRARDRRLMTVPIRTPITLAICRYFNPSTAHRSSTQVAGSRAACAHAR